MSPESIRTVRRFHRLVTQRAGALEDHFLGRDRPLGQSRVLYEVGAEGATLRALRSRLGLDSGYLSRLIQGLISEGLLDVEAGAEDERVRVARLTDAGVAELEDMDRRADAVAIGILEPLPVPFRDRLVAAMAEVDRFLRLSGLRIERVDPASEEARFCVARYFEELARRFPEGFDPAASLPADDADLVPPRGAFLMASTDGRAVACGAVKRLDGQAHVGSLKRMWVDDSMRGLGVGRRMLEALEDAARSLGLGTLRLETNASLQEAIGLYRTAGYAEVAAFNDDPYAQHWFEKRLG